MGGAQVPSTTGTYWFVSSVVGSDGNDGLSVTSPKATISAAAVASNSANGSNNGDVIIVDTAHVENVNAAAYLTLSQSGIYLIGMGTGAQRPTLTWKTSTAAQIIVSGNNVVFDNFVFDFTGIDAVVAAFSVTGTDVAFVNSTFLTNSASNGVVLGILTAATATRFRVENCLFFGAQTNSGTTSTSHIQHESGADYIIRNNVFTGKTVNFILNVAQVLRGVVDNNRFVQYTGTQVAIFSSTSTVFFVNNRINVPSGTSCVVFNSGRAAGNIMSNTTSVSVTAQTF